ncbi:MAG: tetratricopeptide repeat protein [bacterium]|nr:tetratricopeptide repeat protein [bacterium]
MNTELNDAEQQGRPAPSVRWAYAVFPALCAACLVFISGPGCTRDEGSTGGATEAKPVSSGALPALEMIEGAALIPGEPPVMTARIDQEAFEKACEDAGLPRPPVLEKLNATIAQAVYATNDALLVERTAARYGLLGHLYEIAAGAKRDLRRSAECYDAAKALEPDQFEWPYRLGRVFSNRGSTERADLELAAAEAIRPEYAMVAWYRGQVDLAEERPELALAHFQRYVELKPNDERGHIGLALAHIMAKDSDAALAALQTAIRMRPESREAHIRLAQVYTIREEAELAAQAGQTAASLPAETGILERDPVELAAWAELPIDVVCLRLDLLGQMGNTPAGVYLCEYLLKQHGNDERLMIRLGRLHLTARAPELAEEAFRKTIADHPRSAPAYRGLADALSGRGAADDAIEAMRKAIELAPDDAIIRMRMAGLLASTNDWSRIIKHLEVAVKHAPGYARARHLLGRAHLGAGDLTAAKACFARTVQDSPEFEDGYLALCALAQQEGDRSAAELYVRQGLESIPESPRLSNALAWILATSPDPAQRNGEEAVRRALKACQLTRFRVYGLLDTLAAAYAESGQFDLAVTTQSDVVRLATEAKDATLEGFESRLKLYGQRQPYRVSE